MLHLAGKRRKTDRFNQYFRLKRIAAAQIYGRSAPPGQGPGPASAPLPSAGNAAQEPPAEALQLLQASQKRAKIARTDRLKNSFRQNELIKETFGQKRIDSTKKFAGRNEGNGILR
jgi:hypothetical protein